MSQQMDLIDIRSWDRSDLITLGLELRTHAMPSERSGNPVSGLTPSVSGRFSRP